MNILLDQEIRYRLLKLLSSKGNLSQREMASHLGISLGKINGFISDLTQRGFILVQQTRGSGKRMKYLYLLTSEGLEEKAGLAMNFLKTRISDYEKIRKQIRELFDEVSEAEVPSGGKPQGLKEL
jgi:EPS-associated MarR family transcriptional regulator